MLVNRVIFRWRWKTKVPPRKRQLGDVWVLNMSKAPSSHMLEAASGASQQANCFCSTPEFTFQKVSLTQACCCCFFPLTTDCKTESTREFTVFYYKMHGVYCLHQATLGVLVLHMHSEISVLFGRILGKLRYFLFQDLSGNPSMWKVPGCQVMQLLCWWGKCQSRQNTTRMVSMCVLEWFHLT